MTIDKNKLKEMLSSAALLLKDNSDYLSEIDSKFGDGDHGITINKIAILFEKEISEWNDDTSIHDFFEKLGMDIMAVNGGSAGPLYGTMIGGFAEGLNEQEQLTAVDLKEMLMASLSEMRDITTAKIGDKTMMDALIPAVEAAEKCEGEVEKLAQVVIESAKQGAKDSEKYISKFGRAKSYKEETIGTPDAGAVSTALFLEGFFKPLV